MDDLSLSEIGENLGITRSAVYDTIKKSNNLLLSYESKLKLLEKENKLNEILEASNDLTKEELINKIREI